jgi:hypothetical protein
MMTKTRQVDEFGNVSYEVREDGQVLGVIAKTCSAWQVEPGGDSYVPVRSVKAGMEWFTFQAQVLARPKVTTTELAAQIAADPRFASGDSTFFGEMAGQYGRDFAGLAFVQACLKADQDARRQVFR